nr:tryptophan 2,3-dioxygenase A-like isoform X4 [Crassostrea gigas]
MCNFTFGNFTDMADKPKKLTYETYLGLDKLLKCQELESEKAGNRVAEEHLFIIVHQGFEIWFKQILEDFKGVIDILKEPKIEERTHLSGITTKLGRCILILKVVIQHFEIIETMPPAVFLNFRKYLKSGSGFQSLQFRQIENTLGLRPETREQDQPGKDYKDALNTEQSELAKDSEKGDTLFSVAETWLKNVFGTYVRDRVQYFNVLSEMMKTWAEDTTMEEHHRGNKEAFDKILKEDTYETIPDTHVLMVHRMLGKKTGTGGSSGYDYLKRTNQDKYRVFMEFFNMGAYLIPEEYKKGKKPYSVPESVGGI